MNQAVSKKQVYSKHREQHLSCVQIHVHVLPRGITTERYLTVYVDKNTLQQSSNWAKIMSKSLRIGKKKQKLWAIIGEFANFFFFLKFWPNLGPMELLLSSLLAQMLIVFLFAFKKFFSKKHYYIFSTPSTPS